MTKPKVAPGVTRLLAMDLRPRAALVRPVIAAVVASPKVAKPVPRHKPVPAEQGALL